MARVGQHAAGAAQIVGDGDARRGQALRCDVAERLRADLGQAPAAAPAATRPRKAAEVGGAGKEVDVVAARGLDVARGALAASTVATRVPEPCLLSRNPSATSWLYASTTRRRDTPRSVASTRVDGIRVCGVEPAGADGGAQPVGELAVQRFGRGAVEFDQQLRTGSGTRNCHKSGAYPEAIDELA